MRGVRYDFAFLAPICDMRRLTFEEEEEARKEKKSGSKNSTVYYDRIGNPFRKIIVQPILQATQDGTCKSRALAVLGWLLKLDQKKLAWYVLSNRELFQAELTSVRAGLSKQTFDGMDRTVDSEVDVIFGSLMATGKRDKFGRDVHMKVCHLDTLNYNESVPAIRSECDEVGATSSEVSQQLLQTSPDEVALRQKREVELLRIRDVLLRNSKVFPAQVVDQTLSLSSPSASGEVLRRRSQEWRSIEDHEARWQFLEETCFFGHNLGFKKIKKLYSKDEIMLKTTGSLDTMSTTQGARSDSQCKDDSCGFGDTKYLRKYIMSTNEGNYISHEADPVFHQPLENFLGFLCNGDEQSKVAVPFFVLPFPGAFMGLSLDDYVDDKGWCLHWRVTPMGTCSKKFPIILCLRATVF
jgi:hypothetical protein